MSKRVKERVVIMLVFVMALCVRLYGITTPAPEPDEVHWMVRSYTIIERIRSKDYYQLTTHLGHPGLVPAIVMAAGQWVGEKINTYNNTVPGQSSYLDKLDAARIANAITSSLLVFVVFYGAKPFFGFGVSLLAATLIMLDPTHLAMSRQAHLDSFLTLLVTITVFSFLASVRKQSVSLRLLSGIFWGLCIATKPTALSLIVSFTIIKAIYYFYKKANEEKTESLIAPIDLWFILLGHSVLCSLYTRLWHHQSEYSERLKIKSVAADYIYAITTSLYPFRYFVLLIALLLSFTIYLRANRVSLRSLKEFFVSSYTLFAACFFTLIVFFPAVTETLIRFWTWVFGLSGEQHVSFGHTWDPIAYGYAQLLYRRLPEIIFGGGVLFLFWFLKDLLKRKNSVFLYNSFFLITVLMWILPLSFSAKQTIRYLLPIFPFLYLVAIDSLTRLLRSLLKRIHFREGRIAQVVCSLLLIGNFSYVSAVFYPYYTLYFNYMSGGLVAAKEVKGSLSFVGENEAVHFLHEKAAQRGKKLDVSVLGDVSALIHTYHRLFPGEPLNVKFKPFTSPFGGDYLLMLGAMDTLLSEIYKEYYHLLEPLYQFEWGGVVHTAIFKVPANNFMTPFEFSLAEAFNAVGKKHFIELNQYEKFGIRKEQRDVEVVFVGETANSKKGFLMFGERIKVAEGNYKIDFILKVPNFETIREQLPKDKPVARLYFGKCERSVLLEEVPNNEFNTYTLECAVKAENTLQLRLYTFNTVDIYLIKAGIVNTAFFTSSDLKESP